MWLIRQPLLLKKRLLLGNHRLHLLQSLADTLGQGLMWQWGLVPKFLGI